MSEVDLEYEWRNGRHVFPVGCFWEIDPNGTLKIRSDDYVAGVAYAARAWGHVYRENGQVVVALRGE